MAIKEIRPTESELTKLIKIMVKEVKDDMETKINDGDLVVAKKTNNPDNGSVVVCINNGEALIKKVQKEKHGYILSSLNSEKYPPFFASKDFRVIGEVKSIFSYNI